MSLKLKILFIIILEHAHNCPPQRNCISTWYIYTNTKWTTTLEYLRYVDLPSKSYINMKFYLKTFHYFHK